ncbi:MAG: AMP-binding protein [Candidatus Eremiobacterota bacterium]
MEVYLSNKRYIYNMGLAFYNIVEKYQDKKAIIFDNLNSCTFDELNKLSNKIARFLLDNNIRQNDVICLFNKKSLFSYATMLAALKIGVIYSNLDFTSPAMRINKMLDTARPSIIFNDSALDISKFNLDNRKVINFASENFIQSIQDYDSGNLISITKTVCGNNGAYIMFTSGSTGFPKGALMSHLNILNFISWGIERYDVKTDDIFTNVNPIYFDNSVFDFYISLFSGASLAPLPYELTQFPKKIVEWVSLVKPTIWFSVPSFLVYLLTTKSLKEKDFQSLRIISFGGEGFPKQKLKQLFNLYGKRTKLINVYGPTECTCICSAYDITEKDFDDMKNFAPLGEIALNFKCQIIPIGHDCNMGELCLLGPQVGLGYYNDLERTKRSFVFNSDNVRYNEIIYLTGDLVRCDENSVLHFIGRKDNQIKHLGYRIELEEIETSLNSLSYINQSAVIYKRIHSDFGQIIAFVKLNKDIDRAKIIDDLKLYIPQYMLPNKLEILDELPKNANGKIDRIKLLEQSGG